MEETAQHIGNGGQRVTRLMQGNIDTVKGRAGGIQEATRRIPSIRHDVELQHRDGQKIGTSSIRTRPRAETGTLEREEIVKGK